MNLNFILIFLKPYWIFFFTIAILSIIRFLSVEIWSIFVIHAFFDGIFDGFCYRWNAALDF